MTRHENIFETTDRLVSEEMQAGIRFGRDGLPVFEDWMFCGSLPKEILPYDHRTSASDPKSAAICFFEPDIRLYPRIEFLDETASQLLGYSCFIGFDLSVFYDFLKPFQDFYVLANLAVDIYLILKGCRMIPNLRAGEDGGSHFNLFEEAPIVACGTLGCSKRKATRERNRRAIEWYAESHPGQTVIQYGPSLVSRKNTLAFPAFGWRKHR